MNTTLAALRRWSAILGLGLGLAILIPLSAITHWTNGAALSLAEKAKAKLAELWGAK